MLEGSWGFYVALMALWGMLAWLTSEPLLNVKLFACMLEFIQKPKKLVLRANQKNAKLEGSWGV